MALEVGPQPAAVLPPRDGREGLLRAVGRSSLHAAVSAGRRLRGPDIAEAAVQERRPLELADLADGPYYTIVLQLGLEDLVRADAACRLTHELNRRSGGPWWALGRRDLLGLELDGDTVFDPSEDAGLSESIDGRRNLRADWRCRYLAFRAEVMMFRTPFLSSEITSVQRADEIAYTRCRLRADLLQASDAAGVFLEVEVIENPDNVSLALVDFEAGGCSSLTFSPDTGAVIRERKVREAPRKVEGAYIQPLSSITSGQGFEGSMGLYLQSGRLAFLRRHVVRSADGTRQTAGPWETTGFVTDLSWAEGRCLTPCLAFRDPGDYRLRLSRVDAEPPITVTRNELAFEGSLWRSLDWEAGEQELVDE